MKKINKSLLIIFTSVLLLCSCKTLKYDVSSLQIAVFEDYDTLVSIDNSNIKLLDLPIDRIVVCMKGDEIYGSFVGTFSKTAANIALKKADIGFNLNVVSAGLIEFSTIGTEKPSGILDEDTALAATSYDLYVKTGNIGQIPLGDFEIPPILTAAINWVTVFGNGDKTNLVVEVGDSSFARTMFIVMKAGIIVAAKNEGKEIEISEISKKIEMIDNTIYLYDIGFDPQMIIDNFNFEF